MGKLRFVAAVGDTWHIEGMIDTTLWEFKDQRYGGSYELATLILDGVWGSDTGLPAVNWLSPFRR